MSIRDKIRDKLYGSAEDEAESESKAARFASLAEPDSDPFAAQKRLVISLIVEAAILAVIFFFPRSVRNFVYDATEFSILTSFALGFLIGFTAYRVLKTDVLSDRDTPVQSGVMSGYSGYERRQRQFTIWLVASAGGVFNTLFLFLLLTIRS